VKQPGVAATFPRDIELARSAGRDAARFNRIVRRACRHLIMGAGGDALTDLMCMFLPDFC
jgi:hypothetical protein